jgi:hydroxypyruvate reductase
MARAAVSHLESAVAGGLVISLDGQAHVPVLDDLAGSHPVPDERSERAGRRALELAHVPPPGGELLVLLSGGASSMMAVPAPGLTLADKQETTARLLKSGADIHMLNRVRKHLSAIKGGWLAAQARVPCRTLIVSDVVGDEVSVVASGPTVADPSTYADAADVLMACGGWDAYPAAVRHVIEAGRAGEREETPKPGDSRLARSEAVVIGGRRQAMEGAAAEARARGYRTLVIDQAVTGEAAVRGPRLLDEALDRAAGLPRPVCVVSSGETTVTVRGTGRGGRNQELVLGAVDRLAASVSPLVMASIGTDGVDGPTDAAGAMADAGTLDRARAAGFASPHACLENNDALAFFEASGDLVRTGPTGTNVGDLQAMLIL